MGFVTSQLAAHSGASPPYLWSPRQISSFSPYLWPDFPLCPVWFMFYQLSIKFIAHILFRVTTSRLSPRAGWSWGRPPCRPRGCTPASSPAETSPSSRTATPRLSWSPVSPDTNHDHHRTHSRLTTHSSSKYFSRFNVFVCFSSSLVAAHHHRRPDQLLPGGVCQSQLLHFQCKPLLHPSVIWI